MIYILLPCYNELENLKKIIKKTNKLSSIGSNKIKIIIVNDGSSDQTKNYIIKLKKKSNSKILYLEHKNNMGLNVALYTGLNFFLKIARKKDILVSLDSDNTHPISLIPRMISLIENGNYDVVIASRFQNGSNIQGLSLFRIILSKGARILFKFYFPIKNVEDYTCNFRAYKYLVLKKSDFIKKKFFLSKDFSIIADLLINLNKKIKMIKIKEVPLKLRYDYKIGNSKLNIYTNILKTFLLIFRNIFY